MDKNRYYFQLNKDLTSKDFGIVIEEARVFSKPRKVIETEKVPGRNGLLCFSDGSFENVDIEYACRIDRNIVENIDNFASYIGSLDGYLRIEDNIRPDHFREGLCKMDFNAEIQRAYRSGQFVLTFSCKPQLFLKSGEIERNFSAATSYIYNPTRQIAYPIIRVSAADTIAVNGVTMTTQALTGGYTIDCENGLVYDSTGTSCDSKVALSGYEFPKLIPGKNTITHNSSAGTFYITPRWWTL